MKAAFFTQTGSKDVIQWGDLPEPKLKPNQVLVKVSTVAASPVDTYIRAGKFPLNQPLPIPYIIGSDLVGTVLQANPNSKFKKGQRVWANSLGSNGKQGSFSEIVAVDEDLLYLAPENVSDDQIVAAAQSAATACLGLITAAMLRKGEIIFINGASGNVGSALIQMSKAIEATVIATTSGAEKAAWCKSLGADVVLDYRKDDLEKEVRKIAPEGVSVFWDTSRHIDFEKSIPLLCKKDASF